MSKKESLGTPSSTVTNEDIKGGRVVTNTYDELDPELIKKHIVGTKENLRSSENDYTPFNPDKPNANLAHQAKLKGYNDKLLKQLELAHPKKFKEYTAKLNTTNDPREKAKLAEEYALANTDFYIDQSKVLNPKQYADYLKVRKYVDEMYGYKNLGTDVEKDKYGGRMAAKYSTPIVDVEASSFIHTGTQDQERNEITKKTYKKELGYDVDSGEYTVKFTDPKVQERIEIKPIPNPQGTSIGIAGGNKAQTDSLYNTMRDKYINTSTPSNVIWDSPAAKISTDAIPKKRKGTDNTIPKLEAGTQGLTGDQYAGLAAGTAQIAGGVVNATDTQKNGKKSVGGAALTGAASGAAMGASVGGPWGAAIGGVVGGAAGGISAAIGNKKTDKKMAVQAVKDAEAKKLAMFTPMKNTQAPMYKKGTAGAVNNKLVEVEKDEVVLRKGMDGSFTKVADFKGGKSHERGGEDYILKVGDVVFPGHKRDLINSYLSKRDFAAIDRERQKLPKEVPETKKLYDGWKGEAPKEYNFGRTDVKKEADTIAGLTFNKTKTPETYLGGSKLSLGGEKIFNSATPVTPNVAPVPTSKSPKRDKANWWNAVDYAQPVANIIQGMGAPEKTTRRYITPEEVAYKDQSAGVRQEAAIADRIRRGNTTTSAQQNRAIANASSAMKSKDMQNIGAQENARADQIAAMNVGIRNQGKQQNLELANRYDEQDLQNKAVVNAYTQQGLFDLTRVAQQQRRDKALDKSQDIMLKSLASNNFQYTGDDGVKYIKDSTGKYVNATTGKAKPNNVSVSS